MIIVNICLILSMRYVFVAQEFVSLVIFLGFRHHPEKMSSRYLAEIIPPAFTAVEAFEAVVGEEEEEAEVGILTI